MTVNTQNQVVGFPSERVTRSAKGGATWGEVTRGRLRQYLGKLMNACGLPGSIQQMEFEDAAVGRHLAVSVDDLFVCVSVDGRDYYFDRVTGRFDGTGTSSA